MFFALFAVVALNFLAFQEGLLNSKKEGGRTELSSFYDLADIRQFCPNIPDQIATPETVGYNTIDPENETIRAGNRSMTVRYSTTSIGVSRSKENIADCQVRMANGSESKVRAIQVQIRRELTTTNCTVCEEAMGDENSITRTVYVLESQIGDLGAIAAHIIEQDRDALEASLRERTLEEKVNSCQWVSTSDRRSYRRSDPDENAAYEMCRINWALSNADDDSDRRERILSSQFSRLLTSVRRMKASNQLDKSLALLNAAMESPLFSELSSRRQRAFEIEGGILTALNEAFVFDSDGDEVSLQEALLRLADATRRGNTEDQLRARNLLALLTRESSALISEELRDLSISDRSAVSESLRSVRDLINGVNSNNQDVVNTVLGSNDSYFSSRSSSTARVLGRDLSDEIEETLRLYSSSNLSSIPTLPSFHDILFE